ncbi:glycophorin-A isoform X2 [Halichoerus grypus]
MKFLRVNLVWSNGSHCWQHTGISGLSTPGLVSTEKSSLTTPGAGQDTLATTHQQLPDRGQRARQQIDHTFSEPAIIGIIYAVMLGIIITILSFAFCIGQLTKKSSFPVQSSSPEDADSEVL